MRLRQSRPLTWLASAFYRVRLDGLALQMRAAGGRYFLSRRLCFGVNYGLCALNACLGGLVATTLKKARPWEQLGHSDLISAYMDDFVIAGNTTFVSDAARVLVAAFDRSGHEWQHISCAVVSRD